jgi:hypothetical protein
MLSIIATVVSVLNGLLALFKGIFGSKQQPDVVTHAVEVSNEVGHVSAQVSRDTSDALNKELKNASAENSDAVDAVRNAGSVRDQQAEVDDAIARANAPVGPDH